MTSTQRSILNVLAGFVLVGAIILFIAGVVRLLLALVAVVVAVALFAAALRARSQ